MKKCFTFHHHFENASRVALVHPPGQQFSRVESPLKRRVHHHINLSSIAGSPPPYKLELWLRRAVLLSEDILASPYGIIAAPEAFTHSTPKPALLLCQTPPPPLGLGPRIHSGPPTGGWGCLGSHFGTAAGQRVRWAHIQSPPRNMERVWHTSDISWLWAGCKSSTCRLCDLAIYVYTGPS